MKRKPIDKQTLTRWELLRCDSTLEEMRLKTGLSFSTMSHVFTEKKATQNVIDKLTSFFNEKELELTEKKISKKEKIPA